MPQFLDTSDADFDTRFAARLEMKREDAPDVDATGAGILPDCLNHDRHPEYRLTA